MSGLTFVKPGGTAPPEHGSFIKERTIFLTKADFRISPSHFDLTQGWNILRIISGAFMFPHAASKFTGGALTVGTVGFFEKAGFHPPEFWIWLAAIVEVSAGVALVLGICTRYAALAAAGALAVAVYALQTVKGFGWTWNTGGYEYPVFWGLVCVAIAIEAWKLELATNARPVGVVPTFA